MVYGIEHIGLCAHNPDTLSKWYVDVLGYKVMHHIQDRKTYFIQDRNGGMLELYPSARTTPPGENVDSGLRHLGITVFGFDEEVDNLKKRGIDIPEEKIVRTPEMRLAFFNDPEGNIIHFVERSTPVTKRFW